MNEKRKLKRAAYHLWTFTISKLISSFGQQVYAFAISLYILKLTGSATSFAVNLVCSILPRTISAPIVGYMADNYSRKAIVIISQIVTTLALIGLLTISLTIGLSLIAIYTTTVILSICSAFSALTFTTSLTRLVGNERIQRATALNQMSISLAAIGGPAIGGVLYGFVSMETFLIMYIVASTLAVTLESTMNFNLFASEDAAELSEEKESFWQSTKAGIAYLKLQPVLMMLIWALLFINFLAGSFDVGFAYILIEVLKMEASQFGIIEGAFALGMLVFSIYFSVRKEVKYPLVTGKWGVIGLGLIMIVSCVPLIIPFTNLVNFVYYLLLMFLLGSLIITINTPLQVMMQKTIDDQYKGRIFSFLETMATALIPVGMLVYGALYDTLPAEWVMGASGIALIIYILYAFKNELIQKAHPDWKPKKKSVEMEA